MRLQQELAAAKQDIDQINKEVELTMEAKQRAQSNQESKRRNDSLRNAALAPMQQVAIVPEEDAEFYTTNQEIEPTHESIDLPI